MLACMILKKFLPLLPVLLLAGCATSTFTRVTPQEQPRNANNLYPVEVVFNSNQQSLRWDSLKPLCAGQRRAFTRCARCRWCRTAGRARARAADGQRASTTVSNLTISTTTSARSRSRAARRRKIYNLKIVDR